MYPILEFDPSIDAVINPSHHYKPINGAEYCVMCFFKEVIENVIRNHKIEIISVLKSEMGEHPLYQMNYKGKSVAFFLSGVGAALAAGLFEETIAHGFTKFVACGGAGVLDRNIQCGKIIIPNAAIRDEGVSYHYVAPSREIEISEQVVTTLAEVLDKQGIDYMLGKTWTTDAFYRETKNRVEKRKSEGCYTVEMECSAFAAVAQFRKVKFGQYLYGGDDISGANWDPREWKKLSIREHLFWSAVEACINL
jgi:uridine phosphorylase